ncbi:uncharacterized protein LOC120739139 [Simochromis diagramma]|uniref:uncharacterized protein LOC120739139 n=1 Tax=Simochromis diagramma TaxID=43689 RepID=UPI001A7EC34A|nr:uncharacterized protein LOC120739139 [Simochromis diagramma]
MSLLLGRLLLLFLHAHSSWCVSSGTFVVTQSPHVSVMEGETVNITCCWTGKFERLRVNWLKNQTEIRSDYFNQPNASLKKEEKKCSSLNISNVRPEDSGTYICKVTVEIPSLTEAKGNGTVITVKKMGRSGTFVTVKAKKKKDKGKIKEIFTIMPKVKKDDNTDQHIAREAPKEEVFTYLMRTLPVLALITAFFWLYYVGSKAQQNSKASSGNKPTSSPKQEQDEEEEERDGRAVEAANEC